MDVLPGQKLGHASFGEGTVLDVQGINGEQTITMDFPGIGVKRLLTKYASLTTPDGGTDYRPVFSDWELFDQKVNDKAQEIRVREAAKALLAHEEAARNPADVFDSGTLGELLSRPAEMAFRAEGLIPSDAGVLLVAQRKTGKTTMVLNYAKSLLTGDDFLGQFSVRPIEGNIAFLNYEVSGHQIARWADEHGIDHDRLFVVNLRGRRNPMAAPEDREKLVEQLREHNTEAVIVDPFGRAFTGKNQNDVGEVTPWLLDLDHLVRTEVGARDLLLTAHAGWNGERTRGSTALEDWADVIITMTKDPDDETQRYIRALGRDVELDEDRLDFDPLTRSLTLTGDGSRRAAKDTKKVTELAVIVERIVHKEKTVVGRAALENLVKAEDDAPRFRNGDVGRAAEYAAQQQVLRIEDQGSGRPKKYHALEVKK